MQEEHEHWHLTEIILNQDSSKSLRKHFVPNSFEIHNELRWLTEIPQHTPQSFTVPKIQDFSLEQGYIVMEFIDDVSASFPTKHKLYQFIKIAAEVHNMSEYQKAFVNNSSMAWLSVLQYSYSHYLTESVTKKIIAINNFLAWSISMKIQKMIALKLEGLSFDKFTIVHRDMRLRHLLISEKNIHIPYLIDWEFSNISESVQDLAKIVYEWILLGYDEPEEIVRELMMIYLQHSRYWGYHIEDRIILFVCIVIIENLSATVRWMRTYNETDFRKNILLVEKISSLLV